MHDGEADAYATLRGCGGAGYQQGYLLEPRNLCEVRNMENNENIQGRVRRLTPIECERLQGLKDNWTAEGLTEDGKAIKLSDSARYKMIGNGMAQPCANYVIRRIVETA